MTVDTEIPIELERIFEVMHATGSRVVCDPPVEGTDLDIVALVPTYVPAAEVLDQLVSLGYDMTCRDAYDNSQLLGEVGGFLTFRRGDINLILCGHQKTYESWRLYTVIAKSLNPLLKEDRIALAKAIRKIVTGVGA